MMGCVCLGGMTKSSKYETSNSTTPPHSSLNKLSLSLYSRKYVAFIFIDFFIKIVFLGTSDKDVCVCLYIVVDFFLYFKYVYMLPTHNKPSKKIKPHVHKKHIIMLTLITHTHTHDDTSAHENNLKYKKNV